jgi:hypothetical protein
MTLRTSGKYQRLSGAYLSDAEIVTRPTWSMTSASTFVPAWSGRTVDRVVVGSGWPEQIHWRSSFSPESDIGWGWMLRRYNWPAPQNYLWPQFSLGHVPVLRTEHAVVTVAADYFDQVPWLAQTVSAFEGLLELNPDDEWHPRPDPALVAEALTFCGAALRRDAAPPSVAPLNDGGVQVEWHRGGLDVELIFSPDDEERGIYIRDRTTGEEKVLPLTADAFSSAVGSRLSSSA